jgi:hypothetical protein
VDARTYLTELRDALDRRRAAGANVDDVHLRAWAGALAFAAADAITDREAQWWGAAFRGDDPPGSPDDPVRVRRPASMPAPSALPPEPPWVPDEALRADPSDLPIHITLVELYTHATKRSGLMRAFVDLDRRTQEAAHLPPVLMHGTDDRGASLAVTLAASTGDIFIGRCRELSAESRVLSLEPGNGDGTQSLDIAKAAPPQLDHDAVDYGFPVPAPDPSGERGIHRLERVAALGRLPASFVAAGAEALDAVGLIDGRPSVTTARGGGAGMRVPTMRTLRSVHYFPQPEFAGVQLQSVLVFDDSVSIRWRQLPLGYRSDGPEPWKLVRGAESISDWRLTDLEGSTYARVEVMCSMPGFFDPPFAMGEMVFVPAPPRDADELLLRVGDQSARIRGVRASEDLYPL